MALVASPTGRALAGGPIVVISLLLGVIGCQGDPPPPEEAQSQKPLRPLVYTEDPEHSSEAAAARERRLLRQLETGATSEDGRWGRLQKDESRDLPTLDAPNRLGEALFGALIEQDDALWDHIFVAPHEYASLVHIDLEDARKFVDRQKGTAAKVRRQIHVDKPSKTPSDGLGAVFDFQRLELGEGRTLDGPPAEDDEAVVQHWDNKLKLGLDGEQATFVIRIPKILRLQARGPDGADASTLAVASDLEIGPRLRVFLDAGMHLKPRLLDPTEYPIPLAVGNYWRYQRRLVDADSEDDSADDAPDDPTPSESPLEATRVTYSVESVDHFSTRRLIQLRHTYNDTELKDVDEYWLATPRRIYLCPHACRRHVDDLDWLLSYLDRQTPILRFPVSLGDRWPADASTDGSDPGTFRVSDAWSTLEVPAGTFFGTLAVDGLGPLQNRLPFGRMTELRRFFAPAEGIVRRRYRQDGETIVESLTRHRIMPR